MEVNGWNSSTGSIVQVSREYMGCENRDMRLNADVVYNVLHLG